MDPHSSSSKPDQPSTPQFNIESLSGYGSTASSLPGSGAVTPRTTAFADPHFGERAALLPDPYRDPAEAEAGGSGSKGKHIEVFSVLGRRTLCGRHSFFTVPSSWLLHLENKGCCMRTRVCRKIYQTLGTRFFARHSGLPPFKEGYRHFGIVPRSSGLSNSFWAYCARSPAGPSHFVGELRGDQMLSGSSGGPVSAGRVRLVSSFMPAYKGGRACF